MALRFTTSHVEDSLSVFRYYKTLAEKAMEQLTDEQLVAEIGPDVNSVAIVVKHMVGNMKSRWTDFLTSDGEKPNRNRDTEFEDPPQTREGILFLWEQGWSTVFSAIEPLTEADLGRTITIRGEAHSVTQAINRQLAHYAYHCGQIAMLGKYFAGENWKTLSVPKGKSADFAARVARGEASQR